MIRQWKRPVTTRPASYAEAKKMKLLKRNPLLSTNPCLSATRAEDRAVRSEEGRSPGRTGKRGGVLLWESGSGVSGRHPDPQAPASPHCSLHDDKTNQTIKRKDHDHNV